MISKPRHRKRPRRPLEADKAELTAIAGDLPFDRPLLIEHLHRIQDEKRYIPVGLLVALADRLHISLAEATEVASFYPNFTIVRDNDEQKPGRPVRVCMGLPCKLAGADQLMASLSHLSQDAPAFELHEAPCMGRCDQAPAIMAKGHCLAPAAIDALAPWLRDPASRDKPIVPSATIPLPIFTKCLSGQLIRDEILTKLSTANLRGLGGAGFPTAQKWRIGADRPAPKYLVVNADESEPGTFKDRFILQNHLPVFLDGMLTAGWTIGATEIYIYLRDEYGDLRHLLQSALKTLATQGLHIPPIHVRRGAGAYICGEESALLESLEGKRGLPRHKPPFPTEVGLFGRPTVINNVETLFWAAQILEDTQRKEGMRCYSVSGRVRSPGVKFAPTAITARQLIDQYADGMLPGHHLKAYLPGGASGGFLPESLADLPLDFGKLQPYGGFIGSAAIIVLSDQDDLRLAGQNLMQFFAEESCGQCTPCRLGTSLAAELMAEKHWDAQQLHDLGDVMADASICGLGQAAPNIFRSLLRHFNEEVS